MKTTQRPWYVYMLRCSHTYLYTGISPDVIKRIEAHRAGKGAKFTKNKHPIELVYVIKMDNMQLAMKKEREMKKLPKQKKEEIILSFKNHSGDPNIAKMFSTTFQELQ